MGVTFANKTINTDQIDCTGTLLVTLALTAEPNILTSPTDIVLVLDRSGSMTGQPLQSMKSGAKKFIEVISQSTGGANDGTIGSGSRIGIVSFAASATANTQLITSVAALDAAVNSLSAGGSTNHADAFTKAVQLFDASSPNRKVIVLFTDGNTTAGPNPTPIAMAAKDDGITIYCIGLDGSGGLDVTALETWASAPPASYVLITPDDSELEQFFANLAADISKLGATDIVIDEVIHPDFTISSLLPPDQGSAHMIDAHTIQWTISELGVRASEGAVLQFFIQHTVGTSGTKAVNQSIHYQDAQQNVVQFPDPVVTVTCDTTFAPEPCPTPIDFTISSCSDAVVIDAGALSLSSQGSIVQLSVTLRDVCPDKRVALAVVLSETVCGKQEPRGLKTFVVPAHQNPTCQDITVQCIKFILPNALSDHTCDLCCPRNIQVQCFAHYIDTDFVCCDSTSPRISCPCSKENTL